MSATPYGHAFLYHYSIRDVHGQTVKTAGGCRAFVNDLWFEIRVGIIIMMLLRRWTGRVRLTVRAASLYCRLKVLVCAARICNIFYILCTGENETKSFLGHEMQNYQHDQSTHFRIRIVCNASIKDKPIKCSLHRSDRSLPLVICFMKWLPKTCDQSIKHRY